MPIVIIDNRRLNVINGDGKAKVLAGLGGDDAITGSRIAEVISGGSGNDYVTGGLGDDIMDGGSGTDTAVFSGTVDSYSFAWNALGQLKVAGLDGTDLLSNFEKLKFGDTIYDINGTVAKSDKASGTENQNISVNVLTNDFSLKKNAALKVLKVDGTANAAVGDIVGTTTEGAVVRLANLNGTVTVETGTKYDFLSAGQTHATEFTYRVGNGTTGYSTAKVPLTITGQNDGPHANTDTFLVDEDTTLTFAASQLIANDTDPDVSDTLTVTGVGGATHGTVSLLNGQVSFIPDADYSGLASFTYTISDGKGGTSSATVNVDLVPVEDNLPPVANDDILYLREDVGVAGSTGIFLSNDYDPEGGGLRITEIRQGDPSITARLTSSGRFSVSPEENFFGNTWFEYKVEDPQGLASWARVDVVVNPLNDAPTITATQPTNELIEEGLPGPGVVGSTVTLTKSDVDSEVEWDLTGWMPFDGVRWTLQGQYGQATFDPYSGQITYLLDKWASDRLGLGDTVTETFTVRASDGERTAAENVVFTIHGSDDSRPPVSQDDTYQLVQRQVLDVPAEYGVLANDYDPEGEPLTLQLRTTTQNGNLTLREDGSFTYEPNAGFHGTDTFSYTVADAFGNWSFPTLVRLNVADIAEASLTSVANGFGMNQTYGEGSYTSQLNRSTQQWQTTDLVATYNSTPYDSIQPNSNPLYSGQEHVTSISDTATYKEYMDRTIESQAFMEFDASGLNGAQIDKVVLRFNSIVPMNLNQEFPGATFNFVLYSGDGKIDTLDWGAGEIAATRTVTDKNDILGYFQVELDRDMLTKLLSDSGTEYIGIGIQTDATLVGNQASGLYFDHRHARLDVFTI